MKKSPTKKTRNKCTVPADSKQDAGNPDFFRELWHDRRVLSLLVLLLIALQSAHLWFIRDNPTFNVPIIDSREYHELAQQIIAADFAFSQPYFHSPFYAWFLAGIYLLAGPQTTVVRIIQILLSVMSLLVLYGLSRRFFSRPSARVTAALWVFYGPVIFFYGELVNVPWILLLNLLSLYLVARAIAVSGSLRWLAAGLALGFAAVTRPDILPFAGLICAWLLWNAQRTGAWKKQLGMMTLFLLGAVAPATGVGMRNFAIARTFAPLPANSGLNFYIGNNPNYRQTIGIRPGAAWENLINMPIRDGVSIDPHDISGSRYFYEKALLFVRSDFSMYLEAILYKFRTLFSGYELPETFDIYAFRKYSPIMQILVWRIGSFGFPYSLLLLLGVAGICLNIAEGRYRPLFPLYAMTSAFVFSLIFYWNSSRYRMSLVALLMLFAGYGAVGLWSLWRQRDIFAHKHLYSLSAGALFVVLVNLPLDHFSQKLNFEAEMFGCAGLQLVEAQDYSRGIDDLRHALELNPADYSILGNLAWALSKENRHDEAIVQYQKALAMAPLDAKLNNNLAFSLQKANRLDEAALYCQKALKSEPNYAEAHLNYANLLVRQGRPEQAIAQYSDAIRIRPDYADAHANLGGTLMNLGRLDEAAKELAIALRDKPDDADLHNNMAVVLARQNRIDEAIVHFAEALRINPGYVEVRKNLEYAIELKKKNPGAQSPPADRSQSKKRP